MPRWTSPEVQQVILDEAAADPLHYSITKMAREHRVTRETVSRILARGHVKVRHRALSDRSEGSYYKTVDYATVRKTAAASLRRRLRLGHLVHDGGGDDVGVDLEEEHLVRLLEVRKSLIGQRLMVGSEAPDD